MFSYDTTLASEGSNTTLICQDTDSKVPLNITWSFQGTSGDFVLFENGLAPNLSENKYKLSNAATKLQINKLCANDTGKYICCIRGKHGETILSATALLTVEGKISEEVWVNNSKEFIDRYQVLFFLSNPK